MDQQRKKEIKKAVVEEITKNLMHLFDSDTVEAHTRHTFWRWYSSRKRTGRDTSIDAFILTLRPELKTVEENTKEVRKQHATLLRELDYTSGRDERGPQGPVGPTEIDSSPDMSPDISSPKSKKSKK